MTTKALNWQSWLRKPPGINRNVLVFLLHSAVFHIGLFGVADVLLNFYFVSLGYGPGAVGLLQALPRLGGFLTGLPVGMVANRIGNRRMIAISVVGVAFSLALLVIFPSLLMLGISRFLLGFFYGAGQIVTPPLMFTLTAKAEHTAQFAYHNLISMGSVAVGSAFGGFMPLWVSGFLNLEGTRAIPPEQTPTAYAWALIIAAVIVLLSAPLVGLLPAAAKAPPTSDTDNSPAIAVPWGRLLYLSVPLLFFGFSGGLTFPFYNLFFRERYLIADGTVGAILSIGWFGMALVPLFNPLWERYLGRVNSLAMLMGIAAVGFFGLAGADALTLAIPFFIVGIAVRNTMQPLFQPLIMDTLPDHFHNIASSIGLVLWNMGWFTATSSFGLLQTTLGYPGIMQIVALLVAANGLSILLAFRSPAAFITKGH